MSTSLLNRIIRQVTDESQVAIIPSMSPDEKKQARADYITDRLAGKIDAPLILSREEES